MSLDRRRFRTALLLCALSLPSACTRQSTLEPTRATVAISVRQTDSLGKELPFDTSHPRRWNAANNGTPYEPCTALTASELAELGIDARSAEDAAGTDGQTLRGCIWDFVDSRAPANIWTLHQIVANSDSLVAHQKRVGGSTRTWHPNMQLGDRTIGVVSIPPAMRCETYAQSSLAGVSTAVTHSGIKEQPLSALCDRAIAFTRATIGRMPE
ncbi:DUF3558 family protein [Gordonia sp. MMO-8]|uniref:DUF3558 family protein n=1 Tax=Gordonia sp. MMO-8 TaxID=3127886 RepID=UPI0030191192